MSMNMGNGLSEGVLVSEPKAFDGCVCVERRVVRIRYMQIMTHSTKPPPPKLT